MLQSRVTTRLVKFGDWEGLAGAWIDEETLAWGLDMELEEQLGVTRTVFRVVEFLSWQRHGHLVLRPPFQRGSVWSQKAKSFFVDTIIRGYPVPIVFLQDETDLTTGEATRRVIDGQQRLRTVLAFVDPRCLDDLTDLDQFTLQRTHQKTLGGKAFSALPDEVKDRILNFEFSVHILPSATPTPVLLEIFARMNATGVKANGQELRNAKFHGEFKQFVYEYGYQNVNRWLDWGVFDRSQIARMSEVEFTSELVLALLNGPGGKSQSTLDELYRKNDDLFGEEADVRVHLDAVLDLIERTFSPSRNAEYGHSIGRTPYRTQGWFYPAFIVMHELLFGTQGLKGSSPHPKNVDPISIRAGLEERATRLKEELASGDIAQDLLKALRGAATDRGSRRTRINFLKAGDGLGN